eukprot:gene5179-5831_t
MAAENEKFAANNAKLEAEVNKMAEENGKFAANNKNLEDEINRLKAEILKLAAENKKFAENNANLKKENGNEVEGRNKTEYVFRLRFTTTFYVIAAFLRRRFLKIFKDIYVRTPNKVKYAGQQIIKIAQSAAGRQFLDFFLFPELT